MNEKHREVDAWLQKIFVGSPVPQFEVNSRTIDILYDLMVTNNRQEKSAELIIADLQQKTTEYRLEADRIGKMLERFGLTSQCLSQSGTVSLKTLVDIALMLDVRSTSESDVLLALTRLAREQMQVEDARRAEKQTQDQLIEKAKSRLHRCTELKRTLEGIDLHTTQQAPEVEKKAKQAEFLQTKARDYRRSIEQLKKELALAGYSPSVAHGTLTKKSEHLKDLKKKLQIVRSKLDSFQALPPDLSLARVKVEETRQELASLEAELAQHIDLMHM